MYKEEFENRLEQATKELARLRTKVRDCDLEDILIIAGESQRHLVDARTSWRQASRKELTQSESDRLRSDLENAESLFDDITIDFEVDCKCRDERRRF